MTGTAAETAIAADATPGFFARLRDRVLNKPRQQQQGAKLPTTPEEEEGGHGSAPLRGHSFAKTVPVTFETAEETTTVLMPVPEVPEPAPEPAPEPPAPEPAETYEERAMREARAAIEERDAALYDMFGGSLVEDTGAGRSLKTLTGAWDTSLTGDAARAAAADIAAMEANARALLPDPSGGGDVCSWIDQKAYELGQGDR